MKHNSLRVIPFFISPLLLKMIKAGSVCFGEISASQLELGTKKKKKKFTAVVTILVEKQFRANVCLELLTFCFLI